MRLEAQAAGRHAALVIDANTGRVLHAQAADEPRFPASLTKIMTLYMIFELLEQGRLKPDTRLKISAAAAAVQPSKLGLDIGDEIALMDAIKALVTKSANDIAVAVAEHIAGSEARFASLMTKRAREIGMTATTFRNAHGLPDSGQTTTARDMITLSLRMMDEFPQYYRLFGTRTFSYEGSIYRNHNTLLGTFEGTDGIKTGYTAQSGFNLVASVRRDGRHVVGVVFGGASAGSRNAHMRQILTNALVRASPIKTRRTDAVANAHRRPGRDRVVADSRTPVLIIGPTPVSRPGDAHEAPTGGHRGPAAGRISAHAARSEVAAEAPPSTMPRRTPPIIITPVRPVMIASRTAAADPVVRAEPSSPAGEPAAVSPPTEVSARIARAPALRPLAESPRLREPPVAIDTPHAHEPRLAAASPAIIPPRTVSDGHATGMPPSTLSEQAARLTPGAPVLVAPPRPVSADAMRALRSSPPVTPHASSGTGTVAIQIGAYSSETEARRRLEAARVHSRLLDGRPPATEAVQSSGRQVFRARFTGFDATSAANACLELRRQQVDCLVTRKR